MIDGSKFDTLMREITNGSLADKQDELVPRMEEVLEEERMGTMDEMINDIRDYLSSKNKLEQYLDKTGTMQLPLELVFSWFTAAIRRQREAGQR